MCAQSGRLLDEASGNLDASGVVAAGRSDRGSRSERVELSQQLRGHLQIVGCEAFGESIVDRPDQVARLFAVVLSGTNAREGQG
jgi:hypothetical protein